MLKDATKITHDTYLESVFYHFRFLIKADFKSFIFSYTQIKHGALCMLTASALFPIMSRGSLTD